VSSDTDTVHLYKLANPIPPTSPTTERKNILSPLANATAYFLPQNISEMWEPQRDFAHAKIPSASKGLPNICALETNILMVISADGCLYHYSVDLDAGGECPLIRQYSIVENE
jgi:autophagy-related protein 18